MLRYFLGNVAIFISDEKYGCAVDTDTPVCRIYIIACIYTIASMIKHYIFHVAVIVHAD